MTPGCSFPLSLSLSCQGTEKRQPPIKLPGIWPQSVWSGPPASRALRNKCPWFKPPRLWYFIIAAWVEYGKVLRLGEVKFEGEIFAFCLWLTIGVSGELRRSSMGSAWVWLPSTASRLRLPKGRVKGAWSQLYWLARLSQVLGSHFMALLLSKL